jgi:hypothetical protein
LEEAMIDAPAIAGPRRATGAGTVTLVRQPGSPPVWRLRAAG